MKVMFINPPAYKGVKIVREGRCMQRRGAWTAVWAPVSLATSAAVVREKGHQVELYDCIIEEMDLESLLEKVKKFEPEAILLNTATPSIDWDLKVGEEIKKIIPDVKIAAFGIHVTVLPEETLREHPYIDILIRGEPEITFGEVVTTLEKREKLSKVKGITYWKDGKIVHNRDRESLKNLDILPFPAWDLVKRDLYRMPFTNKPFLLVATSRGCPFNCVFCADIAFYGHRLALKSPKRIVDEMEWIKREFGIEDFLFWSESFTLNRNFAESVALEIINRNLNVRWVCNSRVDNVDLPLLRTFKKAGCWMIGYGIESGSQRTLDLMRKKTTIKQAVDAVKMSHQAGLDVTGHCVIGYPGETLEDMRKTVKFALDIDLDFAQFYCAVPFPGSELFTIAKANNWIVNHDWTWFEQNFSVLQTDDFTPQEVMELRKWAYKKFYFHPKTIYKTIKRLRTPHQWLYFLKMVKDFLTWI